MDERSTENQDSIHHNPKKAGPKLEVNWWLFTFTDLETKSFLVGILVGVVSLTTILGILRSQSLLSFGKPANDTVRQDVKLYDRVTNTPEMLEGSHYTLVPEREYRIEVVNPEKPYKELVWELVPNHFGEIDFKPEFITPEKLYAIYKTPQVPDGSSGIIKVCELAEGSICHVLNLPEINVVISK